MNVRSSGGRKRPRTSATGSNLPLGVVSVDLALFFSSSSLHERTLWFQRELVADRWLRCRDQVRARHLQFAPGDWGSDRTLFRATALLWPAYDEHDQVALVLIGPGVRG